MAEAHATSAQAEALRTGGRMRVAIRQTIPRPVRRLIAAADLYGQELQQRAFERYYGIATDGHTYPESGEGRAFYEGIAWIPLRRALRALPLAPDDVFADLGSGRGQALFVAGQMTFRRIIGVELDAALSADAERNLERARPRLRTQDVELVCGDALAWEVPDDLSVDFMYCPFAGEVFDEAMARLFASYERNPRPLHLLYAFPWEHNRLLATGRVEVVDVCPAHFPVRPWWPWSAWVIPIYRVIPEGARPAPPRLRGGPLRRRAIERWSGPTDQRFALYRPGRGLIFEL